MKSSWAKKGGLKTNQPPAWALRAACKCRIEAETFKTVPLAERGNLVEWTELRDKRLAAIIAAEAPVTYGNKDVAELVEAVSQTQDALGADRTHTDRMKAGKRLAAALKPFEEAK